MKIGNSCNQIFIFLVMQLLLGCGLFSTAGKPAGETTNELHAVIIDVNGMPVSGARVFVRPLDYLAVSEDTVPDAISEEKGQVEILVPDTGNWKIEVAWNSQALQFDRIQSILKPAVGTLKSKNGVLQLQMLPAQKIKGEVQRTCDSLGRCLPAWVGLIGFAKRFEVDSSGSFELSLVPQGPVVVLIQGGYQNEYSLILDTIHVQNSLVQIPDTLMMGNVQLDSLAIKWSYFQWMDSLVMPVLQVNMPSIVPLKVSRIDRVDSVALHAFDRSGNPIATWSVSQGSGSMGSLLGVPSTLQDSVLLLFQQPDSPIYQVNDLLLDSMEGWRGYWPLAGSFKNLIGDSAVLFLRGSPQFVVDSLSPWFTAFQIGVGDTSIVFDAKLNNSLSSTVLYSIWFKPSEDQVQASLMQDQTMHLRMGWGTSSSDPDQIKVHMTWQGGSYLFSSRSLALGQWHHAALCIDYRDGTQKFWVDGVAERDTVLGVAWAADLTGPYGNLEVGGSWGTGIPVFQGSVSDVIIAQNIPCEMSFLKILGTIL